MSKQALLEIRDLSVTFQTDDGPVHAVDNLSLTIHTGEILGLVGESGCGKTVTAMSIARLIHSPPGSIDSGQILFQDQDLLKMPIAQLRSIRGNDISVIFQEPMTALSPLQRIGNQMVETLSFHRKTSKRAAWALGTEWLTKVGIPDASEKMYAYPFQLSGGMRQRAMIAMALMLEPALIIADEPTTALDVTIQAQVLDLIRELKNRNTAALLITHDMGVIWEMCSWVAVMYASEIVESGPLDSIFATPRHPYTAALLKSVPSIADKQDRLATIKGQVPSPRNYPVGCRFYDRCTRATSKCQNSHPELESGSHPVRCFHPLNRSNKEKE